MTGVEPTLSPEALQRLVAADHLPQLVVGVAFAGLVLTLRQRIESFLLLPLAFFAFLALLDMALLGLGLGQGNEGAWFLEDIGALQLWTPLTVLPSQDIDWGVLAQHSVEIGAVCGVTAVSMLLDVSSLEVARQKSVDLDHELKANGAANMVAAALGGVVGNLSLNGSILIKEAGAVSRMSGLFAALTCALVLLVGGRCSEHRSQTAARRPVGLYRAHDFRRGPIAFARPGYPDRSVSGGRDHVGDRIFRLFDGRHDRRHRLKPAGCFQI